MISRDHFAVAQPGTDHVCRPGFGQFRLAGGPEILEELWPRLNPRPAQYPQKLRPQIHRWIAVAGDDVLRPVFRLPECLKQVFSDLGKQRDVADPLALMMLRLARPNQHFALVPQNIGPSHRKRLAWHPEPAIPGEGDEQFPFDVRSMLDRLVDYRAVYKTLPIGIPLRTRLHFGEWTFRQNLAVHGVPEELA